MVPADAKTNDEKEFPVEGKFKVKSDNPAMPTLLAKII
jgi:hypothetical protein